MINLKENNKDHFQILIKISKNLNASQRELSKKLGFGLGKLNYCLNELQKKGLVKIKNFKKTKKKLVICMFSHLVEFQKRQHLH